jgi:hypothetical protein
MKVESWLLCVEEGCVPSDTLNAFTFMLDSKNQHINHIKHFDGTYGPKFEVAMNYIIWSIRETVPCDLQEALLQDRCVCEHGTALALLSLCFSSMSLEIT